MGAPSWVLGQAPDCSIVVHDQYVSGHHCMVRRIVGEHFEVCDLGSTNGTYLEDVDGNRIKVTMWQEWEPGMTLVIGRSRIERPKQ